MKIEDFFEIVPKLPGVRVFQFVDNSDYAKKLAKFAMEEDFELEIVTFNEDIYEKIKNLKSSNINIRNITEEKERYNLRSKVYDTIFVNLDIERIKNLEMFLRKIYRIMKNAANIVLPVNIEKKDEIRDLLEKCNFVAINFTPINDNKAVFIAKKLHGWTKV
ncbi:hypothetical protein [Nitrosophilus kaiyonis]|uniref:hypothetical protein n=1 Tax=Nitrosophilus kaiyonis TaxID=2930200 RepID=UPI002491DBE3|nr:hypothetical protein [Nitrosophilus kaiyonis]